MRPTRAKLTPDKSYGFGVAEGELAEESAGLVAGSVLPALLCLRVCFFIVVVDSVELWSVPEAGFESTAPFFLP